MNQTSANREALNWLKEQASNCLGNSLSNQFSIDLVSKIYQTGALDVVAMDITIGDNNGENAGKLVIMLPSVMTARADLFQWYNDTVKARNWATIEDKDQPYLFLLLD